LTLVDGIKHPRAKKTNIKILGVNFSFAYLLSKSYRIAAEGSTGTFSPFHCLGVLPLTWQKADNLRETLLRNYIGGVTVALVPMCTRFDFIGVVLFDMEARAGWWW
jgi:hypothetical protein